MLFNGEDNMLREVGGEGTLWEGQKNRQNKGRGNTRGEIFWFQEVAGRSGVW